MIPVLLGLLAGLCWAVHDITARRFAGLIGPYRLAMWVMLAGAALLLPVMLVWGLHGGSDGWSIALALIMGVAYAFGVGGLFRAFSVAPISVVGPFTAGYPALVVIWGLLNGLVPSAAEWLAMAMILAGAIIVARTGHPDGGFNTIAIKDRPVLFAACGFAVTGYAASIVLGQEAAQGIGNVETTFLSRFPAALLLMAGVWREPAHGAPLRASGWGAIALMAALDVIAVIGINAAGRFDGKEFAAMGISTYGALAVILAMVFLKEKVSGGQWVGIALTMTGVGLLAWPK